MVSPGLSLNDFIDFLVARRQKVRVNCMCSTSRPVLSGVPQSSVLGPLLFMLYVNDFTSIVESSMLLYAHDVKISPKIVEDSDACEFQADLNFVIN